MTRKLTVGLLLGALTSSAAIGGAYAATRRTGANAGRPLDGSLFSCFSNDGRGGIQNFCGLPFPQDFFIVELPVDKSGSKTVTASILEPAGGLTSCQSVSFKRDGTGRVASAPVRPTAQGVVEAVKLGAITVDTHGQLILQCELAQNGGSLEQIEYNP